MDKSDYKALLYSFEENISITDLKNDSYNENIDLTHMHKKLSDNDINYLLRDYNGYHDRFNNMKSSPYIVYYKGNIDLLDKYIIGIVGPRNISSYANKVLEKLFDRLKNYNVVTISGLAKGVDTKVHNLSVKYNIPTISVLGGGILHYIQTRDGDKINEICNNNGLILSEFKLNKKPEKYTFPQRNRIIAGLSNFVFLPEAGEKSGSLITVDFAFDNNINVYGTPNSIFASESYGINKYIYEGKIKPVYDMDFFLQDKLGKKQNFDNEDVLHKLNDDEKHIYSFLLISEELSLEEIISKSGMDQSNLMVVLSMLEMKNIIKQYKPGIRTKI